MNDILLKTKIGDLFSQFCSTLKFKEQDERNHFSNTFQSTFNSVLKAVARGTIFYFWISMFRELEKMSETLWSLYTCNKDKQEGWIFRIGWTYEQMIGDSVAQIFDRFYGDSDDGESSYSSDEGVVEDDVERNFFSDLIKTNAENLFSLLVTFTYKRDPRELNTFCLELAKQFQDFKQQNCSSQ
jgi:hypothetical protein